MIQMLQQIWKFFESKMPESTQIMDEAMNSGKASNSVPAVMQMLENIAQRRGWSEALNNQIWQSFKDKKPDDVINHATNIVSESGLMNMITSLIFPNKK